MKEKIELNALNLKNENWTEQFNSKGNLIKQKKGYLPGSENEIEELLKNKKGTTHGQSPVY